MRIIGGHWRGRRIRFPDAPGLRPTPDRVRETVFNWLQHVIPGAQCLDLFAGSGALGFEAASRGARSVTLVEKDLAICRQLRTTAAELQAEAVTVECADAAKYLASQRGPKFDVVFLDPPFASDLVAISCVALDRAQCLMSGAYIYMEVPADRSLGFLPPHWGLVRSKRAGQVGYHLARFQAPTAP